jgi:hypothetical protein
MAATSGDDDILAEERAPDGVPLEDVFSIIEYHSRVMDQIQEACFLKSRHRSLGGTSLIECLDVILRVGRVLGDAKFGRLDEENGEKKLVRLMERWEICMGNLVSLAPVCFFVSFRLLR